jgi:threonylcarbamoyladenosine tRNA methylthiotransferase MtaB
VLQKKASVGVIVTGCFAEISPDDAKIIDGVIAVIGNKNKSEVINAVKYHMGTSTIPPVESADTFEECTGILKTPGRVRSFIKIEDGCTSKCAYCIIPKARGPIRSKNPAVILEEADKLIAKGSPEIILTGIEISAYGTDFKKDGITYDLADLIRDLSKNPRLERLGLGSLDPSLMTEAFLEKIASS